MALTPTEHARRFDRAVAELLSEAAARVAPLDARIRAAGLVPEDLADVASLDRLPVLDKDELLELQAASPPFGNLVAPGFRPRRLFQSPGPLYEPEGRGADWGRWAPALRAAGFGPGDVVLNALSYHLTPAAAMLEEGVFALGAAVVPAGVGNLDQQVRACLDLGVTAYVGMPSYLKALLERLEESPGAPAGRLERAFVSIEPLPPSLRAWLEERITVVRQGYGTAEAGNLGYECDAREGLHVPDDALVQVCDLTTGKALWNGEEGQVVVTLFSRDYPLVRFGTGDLSRFLTEPCGCGLDTPRLAGWLGRSGEAVKVRGLFLHPRQVRAAMEELAGVEGYRFVIDREDHKDVLRCEIVPARTADGEQVVAAVTDRIRSSLRFGAQVVLVDEVDADAGPIVDVRSWD